MYSVHGALSALGALAGRRPAVLFDWWMCVSGFVAAPPLLVSFWLCCCCVVVKLLPPLVQRACLPCPPLLPDPLAGGYQQLLAWPSFQVDLPNTPQQVGPWAVCVVLMYVCVVQLYDSVHTRTPVCPPSAEAAQRVLSGLHGSRHALLPPTLHARRWVAGLDVAPTHCLMYILLHQHSVGWGSPPTTPHADHEHILHHTISSIYLVG